MNKNNARKLAMLLVMIWLPLFTSGCGGLVGGLVGGAGRLLGAGVGALTGGLQVRNDGPLTNPVAQTLPR